MCRLPYSKTFFITLQILKLVNEDTDLPNFSWNTLRNVMKHLNFKYVTKSRKSILIDRQDIILWRQRYLQKIKEYRREGRYIYYQDETWINEGNNNFVFFTLNCTFNN